ncbi:MULTISPECIES: hypothetical protein [Thalassotalea]|uniref:hypothetical protein n=1 Tax=Thalassotalea TaxID=1518149 RepID=UPI000942764E|nr:MULTISPECIES: hypothetical protein [Thalassotalea]OKY27355.1 hypothetical protein BI291_00570 [Thalassotalea sp. PP2-459]
MKSIVSNLSIIALILGGLSANASQDYNFLQAHGIVKSEYSDIDQFGLNGFEVRASKRLQNVFGELRYRDLNDTEDGIKFEEDRWSASLGYIIPFSELMHFDVRANYGNIEAELSNNNGRTGFDVDYYGASGFVHYSVARDISLYAGLELQNTKDAPNQKAYHLGANYAFDKLSIGTEYVKYSDSDALSLFLRYTF